MATTGGTEQGGFGRCRNCGTELTPGSEQCPRCGTSPSASDIREKRRSGLLSFRSFTHVLIFGLLITIFYYSFPDLKRYLSYFLPVLSPLVAEAVHRANNNRNAADIFGAPIKSGWRVKGSVQGLSGDWGEAELWIPIAGPRSKGTLYAKIEKDGGPWIFSALRLLKDGSPSVDILTPQEAATLSVPKFNGRVYIIPLGSLPDLGLSELPAYYRDRFGLSVELLPPIDLDDSVRDAAMNKVVDDKLEDMLQRRFPRLANDPDAVLIGVTTEDMYVQQEGNSSMYNRYTIRGRFSFVSTYLLTRRRFQPPDSELLKTRVRKLISRDIGVSAFKLPMSEDFTSLVARNIGWVGNIDRLSESFEGIGSRGVVDDYSVARNEPSYKPEILSSYSSNKQLKQADGRNPCLVIRRQRGVGSRIPNFDVTQDLCLPKGFMNNDVDEIEIDPRSGVVMSRTTDFSFQEAFPVTVTRCYSSRDYRSRTYGWNTTLSWDLFVSGDKHPYTYMNLFLCDGSRIHYERISKGSGSADVLYEHRDTASEFFGSRIKWNGNAWELTLTDGTSIFFPGTYNARRGVDSAATEFRSPRGEPVKIERDRHRNLKRLITPSQNSVEFEYDAWDRVIRAFDNQRQVVNYSYDVGGRLVDVQKAGMKTRLDYEYELITAIHENSQRLIEFKYTLGFLKQISLLDGRTYKLQYEFDSKDISKILKTYLIGPDRRVAKFEAIPK